MLDLFMLYCYSIFWFAVRVTSWHQIATEAGISRAGGLFNIRRSEDKVLLHWKKIVYGDMNEYLIVAKNKSHK